MKIDWINQVTIITARIMIEKNNFIVPHLEKHLRLWLIHYLNFIGSVETVENKWLSVFWPVIFGWSTGGVMKLQTQMPTQTQVLIEFYFKFHLWVSRAQVGQVLKYNSTIYICTGLEHQTSRDLTGIPLGKKYYVAFKNQENQRCYSNTATTVLFHGIK